MVAHTFIIEGLIESHESIMHACTHDHESGIYMSCFGREMWFTDLTYLSICRLVFISCWADW